jgi:phage I-like protein
MNAQQVVIEAAGKFDTPAQAILTRCEQSGLHLRMEGEHLKARGNRETIAAWQAMIQRHKPEVIAALTGQPSTTEAANDDETLEADYAELTACIIELCQLAGYSDDAREGMLEARRKLYPFQYATECAYFRWQVIRARAGTYWHNDKLRAGA